MVWLDKKESGGFEHWEWETSPTALPLLPIQFRLVFECIVFAILYIELDFFYDIYPQFFFLSFLQISDGRQDTDIRNRKKDAEDDDNQQFTVSSFAALIIFSQLPGSGYCCFFCYQFMLYYILLIEYSF